MDKMEKGSEWRKWDLHFHTPSSYDYGDKSVNNQEIIDELANNSISVVAITDHHIIDIERIVDLQKLGAKKGITVLPGIEFLSDAKGKVPIHFIGIFSETCNLEYVWGQIENKTSISRIKGEGKKHNEVYCHLDNTIDLIHELGGLVTIHAGEKSNSIENITHSLPHGEAQKTEIAEKIDFYELGKVDDKKGYIDVVFPAIKKHIPMIICSDNHNIRKYVLKEGCWIKADTTFEGLKQVVFEPKQRVRIQSLKPHQKAGYQAIESVKISHSSFHPQTIHLNQNLNSIIGGRSTGKSILLGSIAKRLNCDKDVKTDNMDYSNFVSEVADNITVIWKDGTENDDRDIEYFPQSYMYTLAKNKNKELDRLIEGIIKQDHEKNQLISNYEIFSSENNTDITNKVNKIFQLLEDLNKRKILIKEKGDKKGIESEIEKLNKELQELKSKSKISDEDLEKYSKLKGERDEISKSNEFFNDEISRIENLKEKFFIAKEIDYDLVSLSEDNRQIIKSKFDDLKAKFQKEWNAEIDKIQAENRSSKDKNLERIKQIEADQLFIKGLEAFQNNQQYREVETKLKIQKDKLADILVIKKEIDKLKEQIETFKRFIQESHRQYLTKIESIKEDLSISRDKLGINAFARLNVESYKSLLYRSINQQSNQGQNIVSVDLKNVEEYFKSVNQLFEKLLDKAITLKQQYSHSTLCNELMATNHFEISYSIVYDDIFNQMSEGKKAFVVLLLLLDFSTKDCPILIDQPEDDLDNRAIFKDLVAYLIKKKKQRQIILVTHNPNIVVGADSELIIVANQNGTDSPNKNGVKFQYVSGSLENTRELDNAIKITLDSQGIKQHVCEILEGGNEAFKQRERKYAILMN
ncbi:TrlF family AAA-like ATPase [Balneola vulgaris]|uniref:TrlF family AAA-like ATPase n=1 Tax=Balneola vulgaris TaxID=287535 RepID=UPI00036768B2|nr:hypothetical protein [Balneola vulgaris]